MSEELQRAMREPPLASQLPSGQRFVPEQFAHIPRQERSLQYSQPNIHPWHFHRPTTALPAATRGDPGPPGSLPPPLPPSVKHHSLSAPPPHPHSHPPPMFSRPPPPVLPRFSQPPPAVHLTPNIPHQAALRGSLMMAPGEGITMWHQLNPPPASQCFQVLSDRGPNSSIHLSSKGALGKGQEEEEDLRWLEQFERRVRSCPPPPTESTTIDARKNVKLAEVQKLLLESHSLKEQLCGLEKKLSNSEEEEEWNQLVKQAEAIKSRLNQILDTFQDKGFVEHTKKLLQQQRAKRNRVKRRKKEIQMEKERLRSRREEEEAKIDAWRAKLQREEESKRQEEAVKCEADSILGEVRHKQSEGQRMLRLLEALAVLRHARATQAAAQGQAKDTQAEHRFTTTTNMIADIVKKQLQEYELEEQTLRVMMEESASHRSAALSVKRDATLTRFQDAIKKLLFGPTAAADTQGEAELSLETLIQRRQEWDQFVVKEDSPLASAVPLPWVLPPAQPDPCWAAFLKR